MKSLGSHATILLIVLCGILARGQTPPPSILVVDTESVVEYYNDIAAASDPSKIGTNPNPTPIVALPPFGRIVAFADIVAVNGQPAKGLVFFWEVGVGASPTATPGTAIADVSTPAMRYQTFQILQPDNTPVGTIMCLGLVTLGGAAPPGAPRVQTSQNYAIVGGTGAFLGAHGEQGQGGTPQPVRAASMIEDPANRRINGGGKVRYVLQIFPMFAPQIVTTANGPAIVHSSDFSLVSASKPAAAGEILSLFATGLGPTRPGVDSGQPFPSSTAALVNSPVEVLINGKPAEVLAAVGFPGAVDGYQVNFRVPSDATKGVATVQISAAWIAGTSVSMAIQ